MPARRRLGSLDEPAGAGDATVRLRALCLALPEAVEQETWERPTFRVRAHIFAMAVPRADEISVWLKAPVGSQAVLVGADPARFFVPPYVGPKGWVGVVLDDTVDWSETAVLIRRSYRLIAPRRLAALVQ